MAFALGTVMVGVLRKVVRLRATLRARDLRVGTGRSGRAPSVGAVDRAAPSAHRITARELIGMAQSARRPRNGDGQDR